MLDVSYRPVGLLLAISMSHGCIKIPPKNKSQKVTPVHDPAQNENSSSLADAVSPGRLMPELKNRRIMGSCYESSYARYVNDDYLKSFRNKNFQVNIDPLETRQMFLQQNPFSGKEDPSEYPNSVHYSGIKVEETPEVRRWIRHFQNRGRITMTKWLMRGAALDDVLVPVLRREGVPEELFYLSMIESGFVPQAASKARATGPWQFVGATGRLYGLETNYWQDERRDPIKSTIAAAAYLKDLYRIYGDWYLAMAAYNTGPGKVDSAIRRSGSRNYWVLIRRGYLSRETKNYVPKMLAALTIGQNPGRFGFEVREPTDEWKIPVHSISLKKPVHLSEVARYLGVEDKHLKNWNPELLQGITPPSRWCRKGHYALKLPENYIQKFEMIEPALSEVKVKDIQQYDMQIGESLASVSKKFGITLKELKKLNPGLSDSLTETDRPVFVPVPEITYANMNLM